jgi:FDF domain
MLMPDEEFDFEAMNAKFDKATLSTTLQEVGGGTGVGGAGVVGLDDGKNAHAPGHGTAELEHIEVKYDKATSFFDNLEPPSRERATPAERAYRRNADFETFGETHTVQNRGYGRFRGGRRGRDGVYRGGRQDV